MTGRPARFLIAYLGGEAAGQGGPKTPSGSRGPQSSSPRGRAARWLRLARAARAAELSAPVVTVPGMEDLAELAASATGFAAREHLTVVPAVPWLTLQRAAAFTCGSTGDGLRGRPGLRRWPPRATLPWP